MKPVFLLAVCLALASSAPAQESARRPMQIDDLFRFKRVSDPQISPDGKLVAFVVGTVDLEANKTDSSISLYTTFVGTQRHLTNSSKSDRHPRWSPDGQFVLFESRRSGETQLWVINVNGGEARQLTNLSTGASTGIWSRDGKCIAFVSSVWPEFSHRPFKESDGLNRKRIDENARSPVKARVFTRLFFRHWDEYVEDKRQHLFVQDVAFTEGGECRASGEPRDITPGDRDANPTSSTFSIGDDFAFSPDGSHVLFTAAPAKNEAWSTNYDICRAPITGAKAECVTTANSAADGTPRFSPDGKRLAYRAQARAGDEADRWQLMIVETDASGRPTGKPRSVTESLDSSVEEYTWSHNHALYFTAEENGSTPIWHVSLKQGNFKKLSETNTNSSLSSRKGSGVVYLNVSMNRPAEIKRTTETMFENPAGPSRYHEQGTAVNFKLLAQLDLPRPESIKIKGAGGTPMQMWILKPPGFDPAKKWPLVYLVHGGPQGAWSDSWSYRWNPQVWAAQGYVIALPNPRGSTGYGQKYVDEISGDWGGKCYEDLMAGVAYLEEQPYIDAERMAAAGASFGGYMMNWFAVNTGKFKTLITHCGVWNFESMYATTEELWFDEWEHGGPPWGKRESYEKYSPHRFAKNLARFRTPMLIIQNDRDYRVPVSEGIQLFTTLQRLGVPSRMINFPDEGHWVLKPKNSEYWHREVFAWLKKHVPPGGR